MKSVKKCYWYVTLFYWISDVEQWIKQFVDKTARNVFNMDKTVWSVLNVGKPAWSVLNVDKTAWSVSKNAVCRLLYWLGRV